MSLLPDYIDPSWKEFLSHDIITELTTIEQKIGNHFNPTDRNKVLRFLTVPLNQVNVIWLGQDVYPAEGVATGRAFEVGNLHSWQEPFRQASLKNIIRLIHKNYQKIDQYDDIKTFKAIREEMEVGTFPIQSPSAWFASLEQQGVLFLNSAFTCEINVANSHKQIWHDFSTEVLHYISKQRPDIIWFLWGKEAIAKKAYINEGIFYESRHPSRCSKTYKDDFLNFSGFQQTFETINWLG